MIKHVVLKSEKNLINSQKRKEKKEKERTRQLSSEMTGTHPLAILKLTFFDL